MRRIIQRIAALASIAWIFLPGAASALTYGPPSLDLKADPGQVLKETLSLKNETSEPLTVTAEAMNFEGIPGDETSGVPQFSPVGQSVEGRELASWMEFPDGKIVLAPGAQDSLDFVIRVPADAEAGSRFGAVALTTSSSGTGGGVSLVNKSMSLVLLAVSGDSKEELKLLSFKADPSVAGSLPVRFEARVRNDGDIHERPYGEVIVRNPFGRTVVTLPLNRTDNVSVLPGGARRLAATWSGRSGTKGTPTLIRQWKDFAVGPYTADIVLRYGGHQQLTGTVRFWMVPWAALSVMAFGILALALALRRFFSWYQARARHS